MKGMLLFNLLEPIKIKIYNQHDKCEIDLRVNILIIIFLLFKYNINKPLSPARRY